MLFSTLFQFFTRLLTSNHLKLFSTYLVRRNGTMLKTCISAPQNAKKENKLNLKTNYVTVFLLTVRTSIMKDYTCHYVVSTKKTNVYINFNKNNENLEIVSLKLTGNLNSRKSFPICMIVVMASGKYELNIHFTFQQEIYPPHIRKHLICFSHNICRDLKQSISRSL